MSGEIVIHDNHIKAFGINFYRGNAPSLTLGSVGDKESSVFTVNYVTAEDRVPVPKWKINQAFVLEVDTSSLSEKDIGAAINVPSLGSISAGTASQKLREQSLKLVQLEILPKVLVKAANESPQVLETLKRIGTDGRLVHKIIVAMEAKTATTVASASSLDATATADGISISASAGGGGATRTTVNLSTCTLGYLLLKPEWKALLKSNWKQIEDWEEDRWGLE
jgi:hypothetical protein